MPQSKKIPDRSYSTEMENYIKYMNQKYKPVFEMMEMAGKKLRKYHGKVELLSHKNEIHDTSALTQIDLDIEKFLTANLVTLFPGAGILGEEYGMQGNPKKYWTLDPIDGTAHFVRGMPFSTCMTALVEDNQVIFSIIYDFLHNDFYWAEKNKGAYKNKQRINVSSRTINRSYISYESNLSKPGNLKKYALIDSKAVIFHSINCGWEYAMTACELLIRDSPASGTRHLEVY
jgi:fructose-1,6-bisphosphatase/inositol monophosphatase family enzyme